MAKRLQRLPAGDTQLSDIRDAVNYLVDYLDDQPQHVLFQRQGPLAYPLTLDAGLAEVWGVMVRARPFPDDGNSLMAGGVWYTVGLSRGESMVTVNQIQGLSAGVSYSLDITVVGR